MWISLGVAPSDFLLTAAASSRYDDHGRLSTGKRRGGGLEFRELAAGFDRAFCTGRREGSTAIDVD
jgi:hypothetical protein